MNTAEFKSATFPNAGPRHLLDDSVMEPHAPSRGQAESSTLSSGISIGEKYFSERITMYKNEILNKTFGKKSLILTYIEKL